MLIAWDNDFEQFPFLCLLSHITTLKLDQKSAMPVADSLGATTLWSHGFSEMSGQRNK